MRPIDATKIKDRIRRALSTGQPQARVYLVDERGYYRNGPGHTRDLQFRVDRLGRIYVRERGEMK